MISHMSLRPLLLGVPTCAPHQCQCWLLCGASPSHLSRVALCRCHGFCGILCRGIHPLRRIRFDYPLPFGNPDDIFASPHCIHRVCADCVAVADSIFAPKAELHALKTITLTTRIEALLRCPLAGRSLTRQPRRRPHLRCRCCRFLRPRGAFLRRHVLG